MRTFSGAVRSVVCGAALILMALPGISAAAEHGGTHGMKQGISGGHDMTRMGDQVFFGKIGPWNGVARIMDMKAHVASSGMKAAGEMPSSHHIAFMLTDAKTKKAVTEGKGTVTVTGPDKKEAKSEFMAMQGHFGVDVNLPMPGKYTFKAQIESGGKKGSAAFPYTLK